VRKPDAENKLLAEALVTPLSDLATFLGFIQNHDALRPIYTALATALVAEVRKPDTENKLLALALVTPLEHLASFLGFIREKPELTELREPFVASLAQKPVALAEKAIHTTPAQFYPLVREERALGKALMSAISDENWVKCCEKFACYPVNAIGALLAELARLGFAQRAQVLADRLMMDANSDQWQSPFTGLIDASEVMRHANQPLDAKLRFVDSIIRRDWLTVRYHRQKIEHLAGGIFHLLVHQPPEVVSAFLAPSLKKRVEQSLMGLSSMDIKDVASTFQLWAAAELVGAEILVIRVKWPEAGIARKTVEYWQHPESIEGMGYIQQHLWMGIRLFSYYHPNPIPIPANVVSDVLRRWEMTALDPNRTSVQKGWDLGMIHWFEQCAASGNGTLVRDVAPLQTALAPSSN